MNNKVLLQVAWGSGIGALVWFAITQANVGLLALSGHFSAYHIGGATADFVSLGLFVVYINGFAVLGHMYKNRYLTLATQTLMILNILSVVVFYLGVELSSINMTFIDATETILGLAMSGAMLVIGWNILNLKSKLGQIAIWYGALEIISGIGITYIFVPLGFAGEAMLFALGSYLLYQVSRQVKK